MIDIVIVNYHSAHEVAAALQALGPWSGRGQVWLVDNSADSAQAQALHRLARARDDCHVLVQPGNVGFGAGCNAAFAASSAPLLLLLNPDARIDPADIDTLAAALRADPALAAVSPRTWWDAPGGFVLPPPTPQDPWSALLPWRRALRPAGAAAWATAQVRHEQAAALRASVRRVPLLAGALLLLRRDAVLAAGGLFDPRFFMFFEDADLSRRLRRRGHSLALVQQADAVHGWRDSPAKGPLMQASAQAYFALHHPRFHRATQGLRRLQVPPARATDVAQGRSAVLGPDQGPPVIAFSPTPLGWPALLRPAGQPARPFTVDQWDLLAPGRYRALLDTGGGRMPSWVSFEKPAGG